MTEKKLKSAPGKDAGQKSGIPKKQPAKHKKSKLSADKRTTMIRTALREEKLGQSVTIRQIRSGAGRGEKQNATLKGLGLCKIGRTRTLEDTIAVRGMIAKVAHLLEVTDSV